jgi:hypothetical protein
MKKVNELVIFDQFRIQASEEEKAEIQELKNAFKKAPVKFTGLMILMAAVTPFTGEGSKFFKETASQLTLIFKSSIRDAAISDVSQKIRKKKKKAYEFETNELEQMVLKQESRIKKRGRLAILKKLVFIHLGIGVIPFL